MSSQSRVFQLWYAKHWTNFSGIGVRMKQMKLWGNDLCPCCRQVTESTTMHLYLCPHPWLEIVHTEPLLLEIITTFWHGENLILDPDCPQSLKSMYNTLRDIGLHQTWLGFLLIRFN